MSLFKSVKMNQKTFAPGQYVKGRWVEGPPIEMEFWGTCQPANGQTLQLLPEGKRNSEVVKVFAPITMQFTAASPEEQRSGDRIIWQGKEFEVQVAAKWDNGLLPHWEIVCTREKEGQS
jgi:hypothetical protein